MKTLEVIIVRIYITEKSKLLDAVLHYLYHEAHIRGASVFRAISGFGESGVHESSLVELSLNLPLAIEFFDVPEKIESALEYLSSIVKSAHIVTWKANMLGFQ